MNKDSNSDDNQHFLNYVAKLKNKGTLEELRLKQHLKCYGNPTDTLSHPVSKMKSWLQAMTEKSQALPTSEEDITSPTLELKL